MAKYLYIVAYKNDQGELKEETISADTTSFLWSVFHNIMQIKKVYKPILVRLTEYERLSVINYDGETN